MIRPKTRREPEIQRKTQHAFGLFADEGELKTLRIGFPDDPVNTSHQLLILPLRDAAKHRTGRVSRHDVPSTLLVVCNLGRKAPPPRSYCFARGLVKGHRPV